MRQWRWEQQRLWLIQRLRPREMFRQWQRRLKRSAIEAGRSAYLTGMGRVLARGGSASDPLTGFLR